MTLPGSVRRDSKPRPSPPALRDYVGLALGFALTRVALAAAGLRYHLELKWMFLADLTDLREHLLRTVYYFHAYPPGMNLLTGLLLKTAPNHLSGLAQAVFLASGLLMVCSLFYLGRAVGLSRWGAFGLSLAFSLAPPTLYFENLYLYDYPVPALLTFAAALLHRALVTRRFGLWLAFFTVLSGLGLLRSALHLVWFLAILAFCSWFCRLERRRLLLAAAGPLAVLLLLYLKNFLVFGVFDAQTQSGGNAILITTYHMPPELRKAWVAEGKLSPFADMGFATPPEKFVPYFGGTKLERWNVPALDLLERPTQRAPNFNHWYFLEVNELRRKDAGYCLRERPWEYVDTVLSKGLPQAFGPSTRWHPYTDRPESPHRAHREVLGGWEDAYNRVLHRSFLAPFGLYALLPFVLMWAGSRARALLRSRSETQRLKGALLCFCLLQIGYLVLVTILFTWGEQARYRYIVEPFIWLLSARSLLALGYRLRVVFARRLGRA